MDDNQIVAAAFRALIDHPDYGPRSALLLYWHYRRSYPVREIARVLGLGIKTTERELSRATRFFREYIAQARSEGDES